MAAIVFATTVNSPLPGRAQSGVDSAIEVGAPVESSESATPAPQLSNAASVASADPTGAAAEAVANAESAVDEAEPAAPNLNPPPIVDFLVIPRVGRYGRGPIHVDPIAAALARDAWQFPKPGGEIVAADGSIHQWQAAKADPDGWMRHEHLRGGYAAAEVELDSDQTFLLEATGHVMAYVNGAPRAGDPYLTGRTATPVRLHAGVNSLVFHVAAGQMQARLVAPEREIVFDMRDATLPDLVVGESEPAYGAVLIVNASQQTLRDAELTTVRPGGRKLTAATPNIPPFSVRKVVVPIDGALTQDEAESQAVRVQLDLTMPRDDDAGLREVIDTAAFDLAVVHRDQLQSRTFLSKIDGSVQSYAFLPAATPAPSIIEVAAQPGLIVALHQTGETAIHQLENLPVSPWAHFVAPEGRRPVGFDWEDWSRIDALEAINDVHRRNAFDRQRVSLVGSGAGGHGALRMAALLPDRFAALASVGGWLSYHSYGGSVARWEEPNHVESLLKRCGEVSRLDPLIENLSTIGVLVQHDADDSDAPLSEARMLRRLLSGFHGDFAYRETLGEQSASPIRALAFGQAPAEFLFSRQTPNRSEVDQVDFATFNLSESSRSQWLEVLQQRRQYERSSVSIASRAADRRFVGVTQNVAMIALDVSHLSPGEEVSVQLDGQLLTALDWPDTTPQRIVLKRRNDRWELSQRVDAHQKSPGRYGGFRTAWRNRVVLVYGTKGDEQENEWSLAKASFDAETFLVRGGAAVDIVADVQFQPSRYADRNVVLYGNVDTNAAWPMLLSTSPVQVRTGRATVGPRPEMGDDLAVLLIRPRRDSARAVVAAVSGTGIAGMRATDRLPFFVSGVTLPDLMILSADALQEGTSAFRAAGFFGVDWSVDNGEVAWRDSAL